MIRSLLALSLLASCGPAPRPEPMKGGDGPKNVILFIGDGMGVSQVTLARLVDRGPDGRLALDEMPVTGLAKTHSSDQWVTDSAAAATSLASGEKTKNFAIGVDGTGKPLESIFEKARKKGKAIGLVTTAKITHATPAPFVAHVPHRSQEGAIAESMLTSGADVLLGGGRRQFNEKLLERYRKAGYAVALTRDDLRASSGRTLGLFSGDHLPYVLDRKEEPTLAEMTTKALEILSKAPEGFLAMIEGGRIDMACHASDAPSSVRETIDLDDAIRAALEFAKKDGHTLVLVTADHGTGALAITEKAMVRREGFAKVKASAEKIDALLKEGGEIKALLKDLAGVEDAAPEELAEVSKSKPGFDRATWIGEIVSRRCGVTFIPMKYRLLDPNRTHGHDGAMVPVYAFGPGAERFAGTLDNTEIPKRIRELVGF